MSPFDDDNSNFSTSSAYFKLLGFLEDQNYFMIKNGVYRTNEDLTNILNEIESFVDDTPLIEGSHRFANIGAEVVHEKLANLDLSKFLKKQYLHTEITKEMIKTLKMYLIESFGNKVRLDYGTGHEIFFLSFIFICKELSIAHDYEIKPLFKQYFDIVRKYIFKFNIEPAGSNGMFAIDDYQFLPFLFGSAELIETDVKFDDILNNLKDKTHMFAEQLYFCERHKCRAGELPFSRHSPVIYSLRNSKWSFINEKMLEEIRNKVFDRFVVMQHFKFSIFLSEK